MPNLDGIPEIQYRPEDPYHWKFDNLPLKNIVRRTALINAALDNVIAQTRDAIGTQGSFANRLNQSIDADGNLKSTAIDEAMHSIEDHEDTDDYVRMEKSERDKLTSIASNATDFAIEVEEDDDITLFDDGVVRLIPSTSIYWELTAPNKIQAHMQFPAAAAHSHHYDQTPVHVNLSTPDYTNFKVNSSATAFIAGSLRVFINGVRLSSTESLYVPGALANDAWTLLTFTPNATNGTFELSAAVSSEDIIRIDYDTSYL